MEVKQYIKLSTASADLHSPLKFVLLRKYYGNDYPWTNHGLYSDRI